MRENLLRLLFKGLSALTNIILVAGLVLSIIACAALLAGLFVGFSAFFVALFRLIVSAVFASWVLSSSASSLIAGCSILLSLPLSAYLTVRCVVIKLVELFSYSFEHSLSEWLVTRYIDRPQRAAFLSELNALDTERYCSC